MLCHLPQSSLGSEESAYLDDNTLEVGVTVSASEPGLTSPAWQNQGAETVLVLPLAPKSGDHLGPHPYQWTVKEEAARTHQDPLITPA